MNIPIALEHGRPGEEWTLDGDTYEGLTWLSDTQKPTQDEIKAWYAEAVAAREQAEADRITDIQEAQAELKAMGLSDKAIATISGYPYPYQPTESDL